ncbi:RNA binding motif protein 22 [Phlyctochytrium planicorne]|nr:RNA binding motif protein 22 [Phlyctochytrium planicorne]
MTKDKFAKECKICGRPFTVFKWCPGAGMRHKKTEICQTCSKIKNVCQTCVLDLEFGLPVQVRDAVLNVEESMPKSDVNREYFVAKAGEQLGPTDTLIKSGRGETVAREALKKMARAEPYYKRNRAHICSFFVKGECKRGAECPFRHELPTESDLSHQNIKDRFYGSNDPVANKMLHEMEKKGDFKSADPTVSSICVTGIDDSFTDTDLRNHFYIYGEIKSIVVIGKSKCAFVNFMARQSAEMAMEKSFSGLVIKGKPLRLQWGKSKSGASRPAATGESSKKKNTPSAAAAAASAGAAAAAFASLEAGDKQEIDINALPPIPLPPGEDDGASYSSANPYLLGTSAKTYRA